MTPKLRARSNYVRLGGAWHRVASPATRGNVAWPAGRDRTEVIAVHDPDTGAFRYALEAEVEERVFVDASVRYAGLRWNLSALLTTPTRISTLENLDAGRLDRAAAPDEPGVWADLFHDGPDAARYGAVEGATTESPWSPWPGLVSIVVPLAAVEDYRETITPR